MSYVFVNLALGCGSVLDQALLAGVGSHPGEQVPENWAPSCHLAACLFFFKRLFCYIVFKADDKCSGNTTNTAYLLHSHSQTERTLRGYVPSYI